MLILWMIKLFIWVCIPLVVILGGMSFLALLGLIWRIIDSIRGK